MARTTVNLDQVDKAWLSRKAKRERTTMTELVRRAVRQYRRQAGSDPTRFQQLLQETAGLWKQGEGLPYQDKLRKEWDRRK